MKHIKKIVAAAMAMIAVMSAVFSTAFAFTSKTGVKAKSYNVGYYKGSDGQYYKRPETSPGASAYKYVIYSNDGSATLTKTDFNLTSTNPDDWGISKYQLTDTDGSSTAVYCIEVGVGFEEHSSDFASGYTSVNAATNAYFNILGSAATKGINLAMLYGYHTGEKSPISGTNADDYRFATQIIIWEYQQKVRTNATARVNNPQGVPADMYYLMLKGRPAEKCYNWILNKIATYEKGASFMKTNSSGAASVLNEMKYNAANGKYEITLTDTNNLNEDFDITNISGTTGITVSRSGNKYKFSTSKTTDKAILTLKKDTNEESSLLIWELTTAEDGKRQTLVSGGDNTAAWYLGLKTEDNGTLSLTKTSEDNKVSKVTFTISGNGKTYTNKTDSNGHISLSLIPGTYTIKETVPATYYETPADKTITISSGKTTSVTFTNTLKKGTVKVTKTAEDNIVSGIKFRLSGKSISGQTVNMTAITDTNGVAVFNDVLLSDSNGYTIEEIDTAIRYKVPSSQKGVSVTYNTTTSESFDNRLKKFLLSITKEDSETGLPQGDAVLEGAVYGIYKNGSLLEKLSTDADGKAESIQYYACGDDYELKEITAPKGYKLDTTTYSVDAGPQNYTEEYNDISSTVKEDVIKGSISIIKHCDFEDDIQIETPEENATFQIYLKAAGSYERADDNEKDYLVTDENGFAKTKDLPYGVYTVHQTSGKEGAYYVDDFDVSIEEDGKLYRYLLRDNVFSSYVKINKTDSETGEVIPYAGAGFEIYDSNGNKITASLTYPEVKTVDVFYTTKDGYLVTPKKLPYGKNYYIVETVAPAGYVLDKTPVYFDITPNNAGTFNGLSVIEVTRENDPQKATLTITKQGDIFSGVTYDTELGIYTPVYEKGNLSGAVYEISAAEDINTPAGTTRYKKDEVVDTVTTGTDGMVVSKELYLGKYNVKEIKAPIGYVIDDSIKTVEFTYAGQEISVVNISKSYTNARQTFILNILKYMQDDKTYGITGSDYLKDVKFGIYAGEDFVSANGNVIKKDSLMSVFTVDENGIYKGEYMFPFGNYYVKEISTGNKYSLDTSEYDFKFDYDSISAVVNIMINNGNQIANNIYYKQIIMHKTTDEGIPLKNAVFGIYPENCKDYTLKNAYMATASDVDGLVTFMAPAGNYIIAEIEAPEGYIRSGEVKNVSVINDAEPVMDIEEAFVNEKDRSTAYRIVHEYYTKASGEKEYTFDGSIDDKKWIDTTEGTVIKTEDIEKLDDFNDNKYSFAADKSTKSITAVMDKEKNVIYLRYYRELTAYRVVHEYYSIKNDSLKYTFDGKIDDGIWTDVPENAEIFASHIKKITEFNKHNYKFSDENSTYSIVADIDREKNIIYLRYYRRAETNSDSAMGDKNAKLAGMFLMMCIISGAGSIIIFKSCKIKKTE